MRAGDRKQGIYNWWPYNRCQKSRVAIIDTGWVSITTVNNNLIIYPGSVWIKESYWMMVK